MPSIDGTRRLCCLALAAAFVAPAALAQDNLVDTVRRSGFTFVGAIKTVGAATPGVVLEPHSAVVRVERVLEALPPLGDPTGQDVTVRLLDPRERRAGDRAVFFTYVQTAARTLGVVEVASRPADQAEAVERGIRDARRAIEDDSLSKRLAAAELVVVGVIGAGKPSEAARDPESEHDALWWMAPLRIETVLKGSAPSAAAVLPVNYATNVDFKWAEAPKPRAGQDGIFILHRYREQRQPVPGLFLVDRLDLLPRSELERVQKLLKSPR